MPTVCFRTPGIAQWSWPTGVTTAKVRMWGGGGAGGGSNSSTGTYGGAAGSSAYVPSRVFNRPASGVSKVQVGAGGAATPSNSLQEGQQGGRSAFWVDGTSSDPNPNVFASGAGGGQEGTPGAGGDGGWGGVYGGPDIAPDWILGGQGQASSEVMWFPKGADAPMGGCGGNNNQNGMQPGGGGAPGNHQFASGKGGDGMVCIDY